MWKKSDRRWFVIPFGLTIYQLIILPKITSFGGSKELIARWKYAFIWDEYQYGDMVYGGIHWEHLLLTLALTWVVFLGYWFIFVKESK